MIVRADNDLTKAELRWSKKRLFSRGRRSPWRGLVAFSLWGVVTAAVFYLAFYTA